MNEINEITRRKSLDRNKNELSRRSDGNFRIHLQNTKAASRNQSFTTTDSLKLYEDQIIIKTPVITELDEMALQKRPLSLCFDLNSSGEDITTTDTSSSTMSSISSSSSSSNNSKSSGNILNSSIGLYNYHEIDLESYGCEEESNLRNGRNLYEDNDANNKTGDFIVTDSQCEYLSSGESSTKEGSIITVISRKCSLTSTSTSSSSSLTSPSHNQHDSFTSLSNNNDNNNSYCDNNSNNNSLIDRPYDFSSNDNDFPNHDKLSEMMIGPNNNYNNSPHIMRKQPLSDDQCYNKEIQEIIKIFNENICGMNMFEDSNNGLFCSIKIFVNLCEPVKMGIPTQMPHNSSVISSKTLLPRGGYELVTVDRSTSCRQIIDQIFSNLNIHENYSNYAIFEHTIRDDDKVIVKRLGYDYCLINHLINMVRVENCRFTTVFQSRRFVLQENERVQINWSKFSVSELHNFLRILEKEERDRRDKIIDYYRELETSVKSTMDKLFCQSD